MGKFSDACAKLKELSKATGKPFEDLKLDVDKAIPCSRATTNRAIKALRESERLALEKGVPAEIRITEEPLETGPITAQGPEETEEEEDLDAELEEDLDAEEEEEDFGEVPPVMPKSEFKSYIEAGLGKETWGRTPPEGFAVEPKKINTLTNLWYPVLRKYWKHIYTQFGLEVLAIIGSVALLSPQIKRLYEELKQRGKVKKETEKITDGM